MRGHVLVLLSALCLGGCAADRTPSRPQVASSGLPAPIQCVPFVREITGIEIYGDADTWWGSAAQKHYMRGSVPQVGAVLVLRASDRLRVGHIAAVRQIVGPREIRVTHANWGTDDATRRLVHDAMPVLDVSPNNDWSQTRFWNAQINNWGAVYPAHGFIYPAKESERRNVPLPQQSGSVPTS
jgi:surface antigen